MLLICFTLNVKIFQALKVFIQSTVSMADAAVTDLIQDYLTDLTKGTHIGPELLIELYTKRLLTESEGDILVK